MSYKVSSHFGHHSVGLHNVGSYQVAGTPWITGSLTMPASSEDKISFPMVVKSFTVINRSDNDVDLRVHFNSTSDPADDQDGGGPVDGLRYISVKQNESFTFDVKCKQVYISTDSTSDERSYQILAELTNIRTQHMYSLTGSGYTNGTGSLTPYQPEPLP